MPKEKVNQRISRRKNSSNVTNSKTAISEANKIAARLAAARVARNFEDSCDLLQIQEQEMRDDNREETLAPLADASSNMNTLRSMENAPNIRI
ncbi:hypothetical protein RirG_212450 [Rhizophagus irregularis DAOM 197198w]|uniref:Uncharacterized protein n=1 Tax=Rhizophagus irregularis (strain DAOM 197198w) TaxID=1432141 RepID=A0A015II49_RHIIW|nr:hypothetical protein RirG_212450 [Rhizophagus irregularis DAOM 197198w]